MKSMLLYVNPWYLLCQLSSLTVIVNLADKELRQINSTRLISGIVLISLSMDVQRNSIKRATRATIVMKGVPSKDV